MGLKVQTIDRTYRLMITYGSIYTWLRGYNDSLSSNRGAGFYGIDLYSLHSSIGAVLDYLGKPVKF